MRTTLALDDDIFAYARERAKREHISIGQAISKLARDGIQLRAASMGQPTPVTSKYALLPRRGEFITTEHVRDLMDQEGV
ncbi:MAG: CopG family transcriptional regulator [Comamonadaceae bacterium CG_4_9_14_0_8_um_filter_57_21]|nr:MAG: CopG family transcriptional regulator [Comamonadaceae bacterium CG_4_9_14_0_8_um_filter_57_21]